MLMICGIYSISHNSCIYTVADLKDKSLINNKKQNIMEIYLLKQYLNNGYDTYDSVVVIAENEDEARKIHPSSFVTHITNDKWMGTYYGGSNIGGEYVQDSYDWVRFNQIDQIKVTHIGTATEEQKKGVLLASLNAG